MSQMWHSNLYGVWTYTFPKDVKCPNCGKGTDHLKQKFVAGWIMLVVGFILLFFHPSPSSSFVAFMNLVSAILGLVFFILGLVHLWKYGKIKRYS